MEITIRESSAVLTVAEETVEIAFAPASITLEVSEAGAQGPPGAAGPAGAAATVAVGAVTTGAAGSDASVTNSGTASAAILDFSIPRGDTGADGPAGPQGDPGAGVPVGGADGYLLAKASVADYDTEWIDPATVGVTDYNDLDNLPDLSGYALTTALATHASDTTGIHGIADTSALATAADVSTAVSTHSADTTDVHGIVDTADLILEGDARLTDSRAPSGTAGGVLSGTYPNPSFAEDMATQAELNTHTGNTSNPHGVTAAQAGAEPALGNPASDGYVLSSTAAGVRSWVAPGGGTIDGSGTAGRVAQWSDSDTLQAANLIGPVSNILTFAAGGAYTLTVPATGTAALLGVANAFTAGPNRFTSGADGTTALAARRNSSTDSANIFQVENESGADACHVFTTSTVTEVASRHPTSGKAFKLRSTSTATSNWNFETSNGSFFIFGDLNSVTPVQLFDNGKVSMNGNFVAPVGQLHVEANDTGTNTVLTALSLTHRSTGVAAAGFGIKQEYTLKSSTTARRGAAEWVATWADGTDASRKARIVGNVYDTAVREWIRGEADGSAAMIGFLGANAAARQTGGAQTAGATYGATEQDMLQKAYGALRTFGLLT